ncbi:MAG: nuclear transport factor 2 family protein [Sphingomonadales bacterium]|nr:nuclear transport factor 2 family protein [Sphingomonadales bacterium]
MIEQAEIRALIDRAAISDVINAYATAVDTRDWDLFRSLFAPRVFLDFRSFHPSLYRELAVDELVGITKGIAAFDATQHLSANHVHRLAGSRATCTSYMHAGHFLKRDGQEHACFLYGYYTYELERTAEAWKIDRYALQITAQHGDPRVFEWAGMR